MPVNHQYGIHTMVWYQYIYSTLPMKIFKEMRTTVMDLVIEHKEIQLLLSFVNRKSMLLAALVIHIMVDLKFIELYTQK